MADPLTNFTNRSRLNPLFSNGFGRGASDRVNSADALLTTFSRHTSRLAEPDEIASVAAFLLSPDGFLHHRRHHRRRRGMDLSAPNSERSAQRREDEPQC